MSYKRLPVTVNGCKMRLMSYDTKSPVQVSSLEVRGLQVLSVPRGQGHCPQGLQVISLPLGQG